MADRTVLSHLDLNILAKVAATVHEQDLLDAGTHPAVLDLCRRCSEGLARGERLAVRIDGVGGMAVPGFEVEDR